MSCARCDGYGFLWLTPPSGRRPEVILEEDRTRWVKCMGCNPTGKTPTLEEAASAFDAT